MEILEKRIEDPTKLLLFHDTHDNLIDLISHEGFVPSKKCSIII